MSPNRPRHSYANAWRWHELVASSTEKYLWCTTVAQLRSVRNCLGRKSARGTKDIVNLHQNHFTASVAPKSRFEELSLLVYFSELTFLHHFLPGADKLKTLDSRPTIKGSLWPEARQFRHNFESRCTPPFSQCTKTGMHVAKRLDSHSHRDRKFC